ncbi:tyrosine-type recombinase/integrase [Halobium salinum]|uniref:Tyrosine-type recombinase/integrase n=1 Tax=Halobium salinum TaxID=1364940 RepID=A0ABD5PEG9_9EURY|nr:site-specific integrase [Halobium salinum]
MANLPEDIKLVPKPAEKQLNQRQLLDYETHRETYLEWLYHLGKNPDQAEGYSQSTVKRDAYRLDQFYRWVWSQEDGYTTSITHTHAGNYIDHLAYGENSNSHKSKCLKALKRYFKWRHHERSSELWKPKRSFSSEPTQPQNYLTLEERQKVREAALEYGSIPAYNDLSPEERDRWKAYIAQRLDKPKTQVKPSDWQRMNSWKIPSMVMVSLDVGLRPVEVERAVVQWVDVENAVLRIPKQDSAKNRDNWTPALRRDTAKILSRWLDERSQYSKYNDRDELWLTRYSNPYGSSSLKRILESLCTEAGIPHRNDDSTSSERGMSWYAIRHSVGTYMRHAEDLKAAKEQLRHKSEITTMKYDHAPVEERRNALDHM